MKRFSLNCNIETEDGLRLDTKSVKGTDIKEGEEYQGVRISLQAFLGKARINLQIDVGFGDAVTLKAEMTKIPTVLDLPAPELKTYPKETVLAEKFKAMVKLGLLNSRMKDFWDVYLMIGEFEFDEKILNKAIKATFERRQTKLPNVLPLALTEEFVNDQGKQIQWNAFLRKNKLDEVNLESVIDSLRKFFEPIIQSYPKRRYENIPILPQRKWLSNIENETTIKNTVCWRVTTAFYSLRFDQGLELYFNSSDKNLHRH